MELKDFQIGPEKERKSNRGRPTRFRNGDMVLLKVNGQKMRAKILEKGGWASFSKKKGQAFDPTAFEQREKGRLSKFAVEVSEGDWQMCFYSAGAILSGPFSDQDTLAQMEDRMAEEAQQKAKEAPKPTSEDPAEPTPESLSPVDPADTTTPEPRSVVA